MKNLSKSFTYGHYILTARKEAGEMKTRNKDYIAAGTVNWVSQISFEPPMIVIAVGQKSDLNETINYSERFTLHFLSDDNKKMVEAFAAKSDIDGNKINGFSFTKKDHQVILDDVAGYAECKVVKEFNMGDHTVYIGEVINFHMPDEGTNLICTKDVPSKYVEEVAKV
ncbi:MAG: flavin reductase family protein [Cryomorphaceae bacterium]